MKDSYLGVAAWIHLSFILFKIKFYIQWTSVNKALQQLSSPWELLLNWTLINKELQSTSKTKQNNTVKIQVQVRMCKISLLDTVGFFHSWIGFIHAFISSRLNYCDGLFTYFNLSALDPVQSVQNTVARLYLALTRDHILLQLILQASFQWLPVQFRFYLKKQNKKLPCSTQWSSPIYLWPHALDLRFSG